MPQIINRLWPNPALSLKRIPLLVDRYTLAKRRWQSAAADGTDFGFDLETHLHDGDVIFQTETVQYILSQKPETLLEIALGESVQATRIAWSLGNLHFPIEVRDNVIRVIDDPAVRLSLERDHIHFKPISDVFHPIKAVGHSHGHSH
jgi:urease accessory protein